MLPLARAVLENSDFPNLVRPKLDDLSQRYGVMAIGVEVPDLDNMIVIALPAARRRCVSMSMSGAGLPALISATGRCVAAFCGQPQKEIEKRFRLLRWHNAPSYENSWRKEVDQVRRQGFSIDRGSFIDGVTIVAVPVLNNQGTISHTLAAVGLGIPEPVKRSRVSIEQIAIAATNTLDDPVATASAATRILAAGILPELPTLRCPCQRDLGRGTVVDDPEIAPGKDGNRRRSAGCRWPSSGARRRAATGRWRLQPPPRTPRPGPASSSSRDRLR